MPILIIWKLDKISIENKVAVIGDNISPIKSLWETFHHSRASNSEVNNPTWPKFELFRDFMPVQYTCKFEEAAIKLKVLWPR